MQRLNQRGDQGFVTGGQGRHPHQVDVVLHGLLGGFFGGLKEGSHVHIEAGVGKSGGDHFGAAVVSVLAQFGYQDARSATRMRGECSCFLGNAFQRSAGGISCFVHAANSLNARLVPAKDPFQGVADFAQGRPCPSGLYGQS